MIRITITKAAFEAKAWTLPEGTALHENRRYVIYLKPDATDRLGAMRGPGEDYSEVILRLVEIEARS